MVAEGCSDCSCERSVVMRVIVEAKLTERVMTDFGCNLYLPVK